ncbi:efflux RND transporter periplasmic adaptor subunit [Mesorhizobium sp. LHD-90]|uniref:efflux RND transporter periplasmic adaptor subunit n=1 Tax=Mesorhizobium sp. LHD-90 TaxID=3071414 RepID=UPI0027E08CB9|nr:efflux RND transporter periplasmic adaptor subunit [Mesorhizobium sp. LHD-90]MDQ6433576.1 efflux RND transporter periplasmic adaptor subunit [Mesorhizobium sp. LHD-90]
MDQIVNRPRAGNSSSIDVLDLGGRGGFRWGRLARRALVALAVLAALSGVAYWWTGPSRAPVSFTTVPATRDDLVVEVSATGTLQPLIQVDISSELSGVVRSVAVNENDTVKKGDVLADLDTVRIAANVDRAEASLKVAEAQVGQAETTLTEAEQTLTRAQQLSNRGMVAQQALDTALAARDRASAAVAVAKANIAIAQAELKLQEADLQKSRIYAPIDGIVLTRSVDPGQTVASSLQAPVLFVIAADLKKMELKAAIDEADIGAVKPSQQSRFTVDAFPDRPFDAEIRDISFASVTTEGVVTYDARLDVENDELLLRPGMTATVAVVTREAKNVLTVPSAAFRYSPPQQASESGWSLQRLFMPRMGRPRANRPQVREADGLRTLYVLRDGQPEAVRVKTGSTDGENTEILSGLSAGDQVITGAREARR